MLTLLLTVALAGLLVGVATNQVTRILRLGSIFEDLRLELSFQGRVKHNRVATVVYNLAECHLCLATHVAMAWMLAAVFTAWLAGVRPPLVVCFFGPLLASFVASGIDQMIETVRKALGDGD